MSEDLDPVKRATAMLMEHYDSVQIFVTKVPDSESPNAGCHLSFQYGDGNFYARLGQVFQWMEQQKARIHHHVNKEDNNAS